MQEMNKNTNQIELIAKETQGEIAKVQQAIVGHLKKF
jgi:hypothetical protein